MLGAEKLSPGANEIMWRNEVSVIKSGSQSTSSIGVTPEMLPRLASVMTAFEDKFGDIQVVRVAISDFRTVMYDGLTRPGGPLKMMKRRDAEKLGRPIARFKAIDVDAAGS